MNDVNFINFVPEKLNLPAITYEKLLNTELKNQKLLEKNLFQMAEALNFKRKKNKEKIFYKFEIKEIPSSEKNTSKIALEIIFDRESKSISIFSNENDDFILNGELEEGNSCLIKIKASEHISGTTLMLIWDKFCSLLYPGRVELMDAAKVFCKHCLPKTKSKFLLRMWRVLGDMHTPAIGTLKKMKVIKDIDEDSLAGGWYEKFGYLPEIPSKKYLQALRYLSTVTIGDLEKIYQKDERNLAIIKKCFEFAVDHNEQVDKNTFPFSKVIRKIDEHIKKDHIDEKVHKLFHKIKMYIMTPPGYGLSENYEDSEENTWIVQKSIFFKFDEKTKNTFEIFQGCLEKIDDSFTFYKIYN